MVKWTTQYDILLRLLVTLTAISTSVLKPVSGFYFICLIRVRGRVLLSPVWKSGYSLQESCRDQTRVIRLDGLLPT